MLSFSPITSRRQTHRLWLSIMLEKEGFGEYAERIVYVAGHKVTTDPLAVPFHSQWDAIWSAFTRKSTSMPIQTLTKGVQNLSAMSGMLKKLKKLKKGGCILWVAPSGGRDRRDLETGKTPISPFDSKTIDMLRLMGSKSKKPTH